MTNAQTATLVFKNAAGDYFLVPQATLEQGRVPAERKPEVEHLLAEAKGEDVSGYFLSFLAEMFAIHTGAALAVSADVPVLVLPGSENR